MDMKLNNLGTETWFVDVDIRAGRFTWNVERDTCGKREIKTVVVNKIWSINPKNEWSGND